MHRTYIALSVLCLIPSEDMSFAGMSVSGFADLSILAVMKQQTCRNTCFQHAEMIPLPAIVHTYDPCLSMYKSYIKFSGAEL